MPDLSALGNDAQGTDLSRVIRCCMSYDIIFMLFAVHGDPSKQGSDSETIHSELHYACKRHHPDHHGH